MQSSGSINSNSRAPSLCSICKVTSVLPRGLLKSCRLGQDFNHWSSVYTSHFSDIHWLSLCGPFKITILFHMCNPWQGCESMPLIRIDSDMSHRAFSLRSTNIVGLMNRLKALETQELSLLSVSARSITNLVEISPSSNTALLSGLKLSWKNFRS